MAADSVARIFALSALEAGQTDKAITVTEKIGNIEAGTVYPEGTSLSTIINDLLSGAAPVVDVTIYYGAMDNVSTTLEGLASKAVPSTELLSETGVKLHINSGNVETQTGQYPIIAIPNTYSITKWYVPSFEYNIPYTLVSGEEYDFYHLDDVSYDVDLGGIDYVLNVSQKG